MTLRATSLQVDNILLWPNDPIDPATIEAICRDWLDMQATETRLTARAEAAERVVSAAKEAIVLGDVYRRALANELRRLAPNEPLEIPDDIAVRAGSASGRFKAALAAYDAQRTEDDGE